MTTFATVESLQAWLVDAESQIPTSAVESAIAVYHAANAVIDEYTVVKDAAKRLISDVMAETGKTKYVTAVGSVTVTLPAKVVSFDTKAIDRACVLDPKLAAMLSPYRKVTERAGTLRITAGK